MNVKRNLALIAIAPLLVGLAACSTPPSPGSLAVDRAVEAVDGFLAEPNGGTEQATKPSAEPNSGLNFDQPFVLMDGWSVASACA